ncbi:pyrroline-5-carboxylate reductase [Alkalicaulis satelles]|uniref:Pyrroline-5-carboxylate reductase n=1 Tax=Alkalicaulis satelles TaxID=2609175 RepID=A0A5M6ZEP7_9PROT|nr:pyrroline-5-carboxylate reductase [Alkalicaulis satelles]KAA5801568.1 pyrroline-5-carboxylate reductase [Alkalicaulis satelles]
MPGTSGLVALLGAGRMGSALAAGWLKKSRNQIAPERLIFVDPRPGEAARALAERHGVRIAPALDTAQADQVSALVAAVKPSMTGEVLAPLNAMLKPDVLVVSIAAGVPLRSLSRALPGRAIVRAMPNTPGAIGKGISVSVANEAADTPEIRQRAEQLLKPAGPVEWIEDERLMDVVTAVSGSGPAYVFLFTEALAAAAEAEGLTRELAQELAIRTVAGSGALLTSGMGDPAELRRMVTSPNGTTQAGLDALMGGSGLPGLIRNAVAAAARRSRQMGSDSL